MCVCVCVCVCALISAWHRARLPPTPRSQTKTKPKNEIPASGVWCLVSGVWACNNRPPFSTLSACSSSVPLQCTNTGEDVNGIIRKTGNAFASPLNAKDLPLTLAQWRDLCACRNAPSKQTTHSYHSGACMAACTEKTCLPSSVYPSLITSHLKRKG